MKYNFCHQNIKSVFSFFFWKSIIPNAGKDVVKLHFPTLLVEVYVSTIFLEDNLMIFIEYLFSVKQ